MLNVCRFVPPSSNQWFMAIEGMRNPKNSWKKSDSNGAYLGDNDKKLMYTLCEAGSEHRKFLRYLPISVTVVAPLYWWKEADTYGFMESNSCSTMHKITSKPITLEDFSIDDFTGDFEGGELDLSDCFKNVVADCEMYRKKFLETGDKRYWKALIQLLPSSYNQRRTLFLTYETARNIYRQRKNHKLDEWHTFCEWLETLPNSWLITGNPDYEEQII